MHMQLVLWISAHCRAVQNFMVKRKPTFPPKAGDVSTLPCVF